MIREALIPILEERFSSRRLSTGFPPDPIAIFPAIHPAVGNVSIWDEGEEATVAIGTITHGHFNPYDASIDDEQRAKLVAEDVVAFLEALFADRVLLWKSADGQSGGWQILGGRETSS